MKLLRARCSVCSLVSADHEVGSEPFALIFCTDRLVKFVRDDHDDGNGAAVNEVFSLIDRLDNDNGNVAGNIPEIPSPFKINVPNLGNVESVDGIDPTIPGLFSITKLVRLNKLSKIFGNVPAILLGFDIPNEVTVFGHIVFV